MVDWTLNTKYLTDYFVGGRVKSPGMVRSKKCKLKMESLPMGQLSLYLEVLYFAAVCPSCPFTEPSFYHSSCFH